MTAGVLLLATAGLIADGGSSAAGPREGSAHALLDLRGPAGGRIASGELIQSADGERVTVRTHFQFGDGSRHDETAVFVQGRSVRLEEYRIRQSGRRFGGDLEAVFERAPGRHRWTWSGEGKQPLSGEGALAVPDDAANGMLFHALRSARPGEEARELSLVLFRPAPEVVRFRVSREPGEPVRVAGEDRATDRFVLRPVLGWPLQWLATVAGRTPPDIQVWLLPGRVPSFLRFTGPLFYGGSPWTITPAAPRWVRPPRE